MSSAATRISTAPVASAGLTVSGGARDHLAVDADHVLGAEVARRRGAPPRPRRVEHQLQEPGAVAQVDEDHAAVVAAAVHPAGHADALADGVGGAGAGVGAVARRADHARSATTRSPSGTSRCSPLSMSRTVATPSSCSRGPTITARRAPEGRGVPHHALQAAAAQVALAAQARRPQAPPAAAGPPRRSAGVGHRQVAVEAGRLAGPRARERQDDALDAGAEADARRGRPAERLDEPVVAAAARRPRSGRRGGRW